MSLFAILGMKPRAVVKESRAKQDALHLLAMLEQGAWPAAEQALASAGSEDRELLVRAVADEAGAMPAASRWVEAQPRNAMAQLLLGASMVVHAWKIRGGAYAQDVDGDAWDPFFRTLMEAEAPLQAAAELDANSADAYGWLIAAEVGGEGDRDKLASLFETATARSPLHWGAHYRYFMVTTDKWGGSHDEMFSFVRAVSGRAPKGKALHCLVALAYCEYALATRSGGGESIRTQRCADEVTAALYAWLDATPATLEERLRGLDGGVSGLALNHFAVACYLCGAAKEAKACVQALRGEIELMPWVWIAQNTRELRAPGFIYDRVKRELARA